MDDVGSALLGRCCTSCEVEARWSMGQGADGMHANTHKHPGQAGP